MGGSNKNSQAASSQAAQNAAQAGQEYNQSQQIYNNMFGSGGSLSSFSNPASLNVSAPAGPSKLQYNNAVQNTANQYADASGQLARSMALRGFGADSPSGMQQAQQEQLAASEADAQGQNFTNYTTQAYNTALQNFWNAQGIQSGYGQNLGALAASGGQGSANTYANLYQTDVANNPWNKIIPAVGTVLGAGVGAGGVFAPSGKVG